VKYEIHTSQRLFQVESRILQGPRSDLPSFMTAFDKLDLAITFLQKHRYYLDPFLKVTNVCPMLTSTVRLVAQCCRSLSTAEDALRHATDLQKDGLRLCQEEFITVLKGNLQEPNAARLVQSSFPSQETPVAGTQLRIPVSSEHCDHDQPMHKPTVLAMYYKWGSICTINTQG